MTFYGIFRVSAWCKSSSSNHVSVVTRPLPIPQSAADVFYLPYFESSCDDSSPKTINCPPAGVVSGAAFECVPGTLCGTVLCFSRALFHQFQPDPGVPSPQVDAACSTPDRQWMEPVVNKWSPTVLDIRMRLSSEGALYLFSFSSKCSLVTPTHLI